MNILHITDLHLDNFQGEIEFLRDGFYQEYIDRLFNSVKSKNLSIDCLVVTGDLINVGKVENFEYVEIIINYIIEKFSIDKSKVCLSIGNHDYKWKELTEGDTCNEKLLKVPFNDFRNKYCKSFIEDEDNYFLILLSNDTYFLSIDSTWNSKNGAPGLFNTSEEDKLIRKVKEIVKENDILLIGCHFPIISFDNNFLAGEESNWHSNHIWVAGNTLRDRLKKLKTKCTIWFHGDVHASDQKIIDDEIFVLTSKFGSKPDHSEQKRQAILLSILDGHISKITCNYEFPTHNQNPRLGDWNCSDSNELRIVSPILQSKKKEEEDLSAHNQEIEKEILRLIKERELYQFGRFKINDGYISLGWVDIIKLMNDKVLLNRISDKSYALIKSKIKEESENLLLLGIDIIGGILASQLSVRFNVKNSIIPVRTKPDHYSVFEFLHSKAFDNISNIENIVIFIDIISTGSTINSIIDEIISQNPSINIHVISIISNDIKNRIISIPHTKSYTTFCSNLKIPMIKSEDMPDEVFVKPNMNV
jgi:orotate phosphoribosyltransferase/predicted MPP superfamily phosphohydrolase